MEPSSDFIAKEPCPECGSRDNLARYSDGHAYCFGCHHYEHGDDTPTQRREPMSKELLPIGKPHALPTRALKEETCRLWGYTISKLGGELVHVANYRNTEGQIVAQKVRDKDKGFAVFGNLKEAGLYGQHLWRDGGRKVVITEGEIDALSVSQAQDNKWPVASLPNGAQGAKKAIQKALPWLTKFDEVILWFDSDEAGQAAVKECASVIPTGKCKIAKCPEGFKDPNDMLVAGKVKAIIDCIWGAKDYRPDGIVSVADIRDEALTPPEMGISWFLPELTALTFGRRWGETYAFGAGTGIGKTDWFMQQLSHDVLNLNMKVGAIFLEQKPAETLKRAAGKFVGKRFHIPNGDWTQEDLVGAIDCLEDNVFFYDNWGQTDWEVVREHIRYMRHHMDIRIFYLDHLTALADEGQDERASLEKITKQMAMLANELDIIIHFISHLSTPEGTPHEEGGRVMIKHFKGSRAIGFWSHFMFGLERNQHDEDPERRSTTIFRVLKDRYTGLSTGEKLLLGYDDDRGLMYVRDDDPFSDDNASASEGFTVEDNPF